MAELACRPPFERCCDGRYVDTYILWWFAPRKCSENDVRLLRKWRTLPAVVSYLLARVTPLARSVMRAVRHRWRFRWRWEGTGTARALSSRQSRDLAWAQPGNAVHSRRPLCQAEQRALGAATTDTARDGKFLAWWMIPASRQRTGPLNHEESVCSPSPPWRPLPRHEQSGYSRLSKRLRQVQYFLLTTTLGQVWYFLHSPILLPKLTTALNMFNASNTFQYAKTNPVYKTAKSPSLLRFHVLRSFSMVFIAKHSVKWLPLWARTNNDFGVSF